METRCVSVEIKAAIGTKILTKRYVRQVSANEYHKSNAKTSALPMLLARRSSNGRIRNYMSLLSMFIWLIKMWFYLPIFPTLRRGKVICSYASNNTNSEMSSWKQEDWTLTRMHFNNYCTSSTNICLTKRNHELFKKLLGSTETMAWEVAKSISDEYRHSRRKHGWVVHICSCKSPCVSHKLFYVLSACSTA